MRPERLELGAVSVVEPAELRRRSSRSCVMAMLVREEGRWITGQRVEVTGGYRL